MDLFTYLMNKNGNNVPGDLFSSLLGKGQSGTYQTFTGTSLSINNTKKGKMKLSLKGNTLQTGTPTPDTPLAIHTITGDNTIKVEGKNLLGINNLIVGGTYEYYRFKEDNDNSIYTLSIKLKNGKTAKSMYIGFASNHAVPLQNVAWLLNNGTINGSEQTDGFKSITNNYGTKPSYIVIYRNNLNLQDLFDNYDIQLVKGGTHLPYEPYNGDTFELSLGDIKMRGIGTYEDYFVRNSGKNLIPFTNQDFSIGDLHYSVDGGVLQATGSRNPEVQRTNSSFKNNFKMTLQAGTYKLNFSESGTKTGTLNYYIMKYSDDSEIKRIQTTYDTFTLTEETEIYLGIYSYQLAITGTLDIRIMLCRDDGTTPIFEPYGTGKWCKFNAIKKTTITNDNTNIIISTTSSWDVIGAFLSKELLGYKTAWGNSYTKINKYHEITSTQNVENGAFATNFNANYVVIFDSRFTDLSTARSLLIGTEIDIALAQPYLSLIEDTTLINQLDAIEKAQSYNGQTNINQINNDLPFNIDAKIKVGN